MYINNNQFHIKQILYIFAALLFNAQVYSQSKNLILEEIVVTAQKREQNLQEVPISISALSGEKLDAISSAGMDIRFLSARIPSLMVESSWGRTFPRFYIRGLGNTDFDLNASQPVSLVYDGVVLESPIVKGFPVFDLERIEVLRGPQGTLFGRNTPAGIVKFESKKPSQEYDAYGKVGYGRFNQVDIEGAVGGPLSNTLSARASIMYQRRDNWISNTFTQENDVLGGYEEFAGRLQILWTPNDRFNALLNIHGRDLDGTARVFRANIIEPGTEDFVTGFERDEIAHDATTNISKVKEFGLVTTLEYNLEHFILTTITGYETVENINRADVDGGFGAVFAPPSGPGFIPFASETSDGMPDLDQITQEIRIASNNWDNLNWQAGVFYFYEDSRIESNSFDTLFGSVADGFAFQEQTTEAWAVFGHLDWNINDRFILSSGLRYSEENKDFVAQRVTAPFINTLLFGTGPSVPIRENPEDEVISWDISGTYQLSDKSNIYARVAKSFRAPSIQGRVLFNADIDGTDPSIDGVSVADTEKIISFEGGFKTELLEQRLRLNVSGFYYEVDDQQLTAVGGVANVNTILNADEIEGYGFEADAEYLITDNLFFTAGLSLNNTEINDPDLVALPCGGGCTILDPPGSVPSTVSIDKNVLPHAPKWIANWSLRYGHEIQNTGGEIFLLTDWAYRSKVNFFLYESSEFTDSALLEGGLRVGYVTSDRKHEIAVFGRNILNDKSRTGGVDFNNLTGFVNEPPIWGIEISSKFK